MTYVFGFDLSLTAPAVVAVPLNWKPGDWKRVKSWLTHPTPPKTDDLEGQMMRYNLIAAWVLQCVLSIAGKHDVRLFVEQYAFSKNNAQASKLMELGGIVRMRMYEYGGPKGLMQVVASASARKLLLGKIPRGKGVQKLAVQRYLFDAGAPKTWEENICDAMAVANFGLSEAGGKALVTG